MEIIKALKSSEIGDNMTDAFVSNDTLKRYPFYPMMDQVTPNTQNFGLLSTVSQTVTTNTIIKDKIPKNYYLRGIFVDVQATVNKTKTGATGRIVDYSPFTVNDTSSAFGLYKLFRYFRITQQNKEIKKLDFNNIVDIITNKYDAFTADTIFNVASDTLEFSSLANGDYVVSGLLYIPFSFSQMAKLAPDTTLLHPLEFELATGNNYDSSSIYNTIYYESSTNYDTLNVTEMTVTCKYQYSAVDDIFYSQLKKDLYFGEKSKIFLDYSYISYRTGLITAEAGSKNIEIPLNLGKLVKRYYIRSLRKDLSTSTTTSNSEFTDGSDKIINIKLLSGSKELFNMNKKESTLISIVLGNSYRTTSVNSIFSGHTIDMTNGFMHEKNNDYSSGFPEYYIEDPKLIITLGADNGFSHDILVTAEYYEVIDINPKNGVISIVSDK